jgi:hypothetical protein
MTLARHGIASGPAAQCVGRLIDEDDAIRDQKFEDDRTVIGIGPNDLAIVVAVIGKAIRFDHRPVREITKEKIR